MTSEGQPVPAVAPASKHFNVAHMMRGVAALWVVLFHIHSLALTYFWREGWSQPLYDLVFSYGRGGIAVFFVLSGFVIAQSLYGQSLDWSGFARFTFRRSLRLHPPYLVAIALALTVTGAITILKGSEPYLPSVGAIIAHVFLLQELLNLSEISIVFWTLTYEFQFYVLFAALLVIGGSLQRRGVPGYIASIPWNGALLLAVCGATFGPGWAPHGLFANYWYAFFLGVLVQRAVIAGESRLLVILLAGFMLVTGNRNVEVLNLPAAATGLFLLAVGLGWRFQASRGSRVLMGLGTISYSLYLTHYPMLLISLKPAFDLRDAVGTGVAVVFQLFVVLSAALAFWWIVERPSHRWSRRFAASAKHVSMPISPEAEASRVRATGAGA